MTSTDMTSVHDQCSVLDYPTTMFMI